MFLDHQPKLSWFFRNVDYQLWKDLGGPFPVLLLTGRDESNIDQISSYFIDKNGSKMEGCVLHFCCPDAFESESIVSSFVRTLLQQIISYLPMEKRDPFVRDFLHKVVKSGAQQPRQVEPSDRQEECISNILKLEGCILLEALEIMLTLKREFKLLVIVDGLDKIRGERLGFLQTVRAFSDGLVRREPTVRILLTSRPVDEIVRVFEKYPCIAFDEERKGLPLPCPVLRIKAYNTIEECLQSLYFENTRFSDISKGHKGSFEWLWESGGYKGWSESSGSSLLLVVGKPGSGKSTMMKYFNESLTTREPVAKSATVARYFYSSRLGELQADHRSMLQSIIYDILDQNELFLYSGIQSEYRNLLGRSQGGSITWPYEVLKKIAFSLQHYSSQERLYLLIDALDEAKKDDTRDILDMLFNICSNARHCVVKVFIASRPEGLLNRYVSQASNVITLQDHTRSDIYEFTRSFIGKLERDDSLQEATEYIVQHAQGVFIWVELVGKQLQEYDAQGRPPGDISGFLRTLPKKLEDMYELMFENMPKDDAIVQDGVKMFRLVLFAQRLLTDKEIVHALRIPDDPRAEFAPSDTFFKDEIPKERYITVCGGNFLEHGGHKGGGGTVQVIHRTVREFFLRENGYISKTKFRMLTEDAHIRISTTCMRYLLVCTTKMAKMLPVWDSWTTEDFECCTKHLDSMPLANYALKHVKYHIDACSEDADVQSVVIEFFNALTYEPAVYLLENWATSVLQRTLLESRRRTTAEGFRMKIFRVAVRIGLRTATELLLIAGVNVNLGDENGWTVMHSAAMNGHEAIVRLLLDNQARPDVKDTTRRTPLHWAAEKGYDAVVRLLLGNGADVHADDQDERTAMDWALQNGHAAVVRLLLEHMVDFDINGLHANGYTALHTAAMNGHLAVVLVLLQHKASVNVRDGVGCTAMHRSAMYGHEAVTRLLLASGWSVYVRDNDGWTAMHWAAMNGHEAVARLLLDYGAGVDTPDDDGWAAMHWAAANGHKSVVRMLLERKAEIDRRDYDGWTAIHRASRGGYEAVVGFLLEMGANVNAEDISGWTALHRASEAGHDGVVRSLLEYKADINARNCRQETGLHLAAKNGHWAVARLLLDGGADVNIKDEVGLTALVVAIRNRHDDIVLLFSSSNDES
ncbi:hypothetical protein ANO14919_040920 [Xylariales sp. No.14919]|nr:hypothetical protein ANO14919_040920 [Xylariales sp. No.14919]